MPSSEELSNKSDLEKECLPTHVEQLQEMQNDSFEAGLEGTDTYVEQMQVMQNDTFENGSQNTDENTNQPNSPDEMAVESTKTEIDSVIRKTPKVFTNEQLLIKFLNCHIDILPETRQRLVKNYLQSTCEFLLSKGMSRNMLNLDRRAHIDFKDIPKEKYRKKTDVLAALKSHKFSEDEYGMLCLLSIHELYTVAISIAKILRSTYHT